MSLQPSVHSEADFVRVLWHKVAMEWITVLTHLGFGAVLCTVSFVLTKIMMKRVRILDAPNARSSHTVPTPRSGGIAIVVTFFIGLAVFKLWGDHPVLQQDYFWVFSGAALLIACVSIFDDLAHLSFRAKLGTQVLAALVVMAFGVVLPNLNLPGLGLVALGMWGYPLTLLWIVGLTNAFNFMDGVDGIAGGTAVIAAGFFAAITFLEGSTFIYLVSTIVVWSCLGFLILNWQPAKIFMGDSGSQFLGFVLAVLGVMAATFDAAQTSFFVMPLLFFHFIWDTTYTFQRRWRMGEAVTQAHRTHLYQLMNRLGLSHAQVAMIYLALGVLQGGGALVLVHVEGATRIWVFLPFMGVQTMMTWVVMRRARAKGLIA